MNWNASNKCANWGLLALRVAVGVVFVYHGWMKLTSMDMTVGMMQGIGLPIPAFWAWLVALLEFVGGIAIIAGLFNRIITALLAIDMVVALLAVHTKMPYGGATELPIVLLGALLALHTTGPGKCSVVGKKANVCGWGCSESNTCECDCDHEEEKKT